MAYADRIRIGSDVKLTIQARRLGTPACWKEKSVLYLGIYHESKGLPLQRIKDWTIDDTDSTLLHCTFKSDMQMLPGRYRVEMIFAWRKGLKKTTDADAFTLVTDDDITDSGNTAFIYVPV